MPPFRSPSSRALSPHFAPTSTTSVVSAASIAMAAIRRRRTRRARRIRRAATAASRRARRSSRPARAATATRAHAQVRTRSCGSTRRPNTPRASTASDSPAAIRRWRRASSCHHAHGVRRVKDARAPVFPDQCRCTLCELPLERRAHEGVHLVGRRRRFRPISATSTRRACTPRRSPSRTTSRRRPATTATATTAPRRRAWGR